MVVLEDGRVGVLRVRLLRRLGRPHLRTVETHLTHAYRKLDISSRAQITAALDVEHDQFTHKARAADLRSTRSGD